MKKSSEKVYFNPTNEAPSRIIPPIEKSLPMPKRIIVGDSSPIESATIAKTRRLKKVKGD